MEITKHPSRQRPNTCLVCHQKTLNWLIEDTDTSLSLCDKHTNDFIKRQLDPQAYFTLRAETGVIYLIHEDFYDPYTGVALQPVDRRS
ncbi:hypothetical protein IMZ31_22830 (plasmid) [Pontibacillus sp. ALD_SL1]|uniref:hypothetical protein n=1 Tax=Pontibacillus sp. ALD_SL1 TaxID=2777185 RepID=UPI001A96342A|nr:hypothetical protein [Pontibacillus sp. ALD_SL1]QST02291.1 hypothetical protein IMZ31_22830 [Pontibacillus sp. ALD_SL1]